MRGKWGCVMVAVDSSEESMKALHWALDNLIASSFVILHVQSPPSIAAGFNPAPVPFGGPSGVKVPAFTAAIEAHLQRITEAVLDHALHICSTKNVKTEVQVLIGDPKEKICDAVEDMHADLLVMGTCSFGPVKRMFSGSVSNFCSNYAQCPVIIVNASS